MFNNVVFAAKKLLGKFRNSNYQVGIINLIFILLLFISPSDKFIFLISIIHLLAVLLITKTALEALVSVYWPWFIFEFGREFTTVLIPLQHIRSEAYQSPVVSYVLFSPLNILIVILVLIVLFNFVFKTEYRLLLLSKRWFVFFTLYSFIQLMSVVMTDYSAIFSFLSLIKNVSSMFWLLAVAQLHPSIRRSIIYSLLLTITSLFFLELCLASIQLLSGGFIGIHAEKAWYLASFGKGADESADLIRVSGFQFHPNGMANWLFGELVVILLLTQMVLRKTTKRMTFFVLTIGMTCIVFLSLTRTTLLTMVVIPFLYWCELKSSLHFLSRGLSKYSKTIKILLLLVLLLLLGMVGYRLKDRILLSIYSNTETGGISTRMIQYQEAIELIQIKPIFGHGIGMYQSALYQWIPDGEILYFPERVHNSFLLIAAESGITSLLFALLLLVTIFYKGFKLVDKRLIIVWYFYSMLYLFLQPVSQELLSFPVIIILLITTHYEQTSHQKNN